MVWNVDGPNETGSPDSSVGRFHSPTASEDVDVKKENLRKIQQVVEQIDADIKYCKSRKERMLEERNVLGASIAKLEQEIETTDHTQTLLNKTRNEIAQAMYNLDPQEKDPTDEVPDGPRRY